MRTLFFVACLTTAACQTENIDPIGETIVEQADQICGAFLTYTHDVARTCSWL